MEQLSNQARLSEPQIVLATFENHEQAGTAVQALRGRGIPEANISVAVRHDPLEVSAEEMAELDKEAEDTGTDVAVGSAAGGLAGFVAGLALFSIPGFGQFLGLGVLAATLGGAAIGSAAGERLAHFTALGVPEDRAERYGEALGAGHVVVAITAPDAQTVMVAREVLGEHEADEIDVHPLSQGDASSPTGTADVTTPGTQIP